MRYWLGAPLAALVLLVAILVFALEIRSISAVNGWWLDELFSLWSTDPSNTFINAFAERFKDTTPPLYYAGLFWVRRLIVDERSAVVLLNLGALGAAFAAIGAASRKSETVGWALAAAAAFLCSGPVLRYVVEGRSYLLALTLAFAASWFCALAIEAREGRPTLTAFALVGIIAGLTHIYAAFFCCCLATGLTLLSFSKQRRDLLGPALAMGVSAGIVTLGFTAWVIHLAPTWIEFSYRSVLEAFGEVRQLAFGPRLAVALFIVLLGSGLILPLTRPLTAAFVSAWALFVLIPLLVSLQQPIIRGGYWLIGAPSLVVFAVFLTRAFFKLGSQTYRSRCYWAVSLASLIFLGIIDVSGYFQARAFIAEKSIWKGAGFVAVHITNCPTASVHVSPGVMNEFAMAAHVPASLFVDANSPETEFVSIANSRCPVLGWAEHIFHGEDSGFEKDFVLKASGEELLRILKIHALSSEVNIERHWSGFVVTRR